MKNRSQTLTFNARVADQVQRTYGSTTIGLTRPLIAAQINLSTEVPLFARFSEKGGGLGGGGGG